MRALQAITDEQTKADADLPLTRLDPDHPCPRCGSTPYAPADGGILRVCFPTYGCGYEWDVVS
jgi:hypothetical protein